MTRRRYMGEMAVTVSFVLQYSWGGKQSSYRTYIPRSTLKSSILTVDLYVLLVVLAPPMLVCATSSNGKRRERQTMRN